MPSSSCLFRCIWYLRKLNMLLLVFTSTHVQRDAQPVGYCPSSPGARLHGHLTVLCRGRAHSGLKPVVWGCGRSLDTDNPKVPWHDRLCLSTIRAEDPEERLLRRKALCDNDSRSLLIAAVPLSSGAMLGFSWYSVPSSISSRARARPQVK